MKDNQRKIGAILSYVSIVASTLVQLLYTPFLVSRLGQSEYGLYSLVSSIIGYLTVLDLGFGNAIIVHTSKYRALGEKKKEQTLHGMFHFIYIGIGIIAGIAGAILAFNSSNIFGSTMTAEEVEKMRTMLLILSFNLFITFAFSIYNSIITASEKFIFQKVLAIINTIAKPLLMIPILFLGYKSIALCLVITFVNIAVLVANYIFCKKKLQTKIRFQGFDKLLFKTIFAYSFWIFLTQIVDKVNWSADQFILGAVSGTIAVSVYSAASTLNTMFVNLATAISNVMLPKMSKMVARGATDKELTAEFIKVGRIQHFIIFFVTTCLVIFGREFIRVWLGDGFDEAYTVALLLILPASISLIQNTGLSIMQAMNKYKFKAISTSIMSVFNIIISIFLAQQFGATGAAFGTSIAIVFVQTIAIDIYYSKQIGLKMMDFWYEIVTMTVKLLIPATVIFVAYLFIGGHGLISLAIYGITYLIMYAITAYLLAMNKYEKQLVEKFLKKVKIIRR